MADGPQLFILEDVTGAGKTEAALLLAHRLMSRGSANGIYFGLPTMATANAMYDRLGDSYRQLYGEASTPSLVLAHSARNLSTRFRQSLIPETQHPESSHHRDDPPPASTHCGQWLADHRKKALPGRRSASAPSTRPCSASSPAATSPYACWGCSARCCWWTRSTPATPTCSNCSAACSPPRRWPAAAPSYSPPPCPSGSARHWSAPSAMDLSQRPLEPQANSLPPAQPLQRRTDPRISPRHPPQCAAACGGRMRPRDRRHHRHPERGRRQR